MDVLGEFWAPFAVPSIAGWSGLCRMGAAMDRRDREAVHGRTVCAPPSSREAQGIPIRGRESEHRGRRLAFLVTFWALRRRSGANGGAGPKGGGQDARSHAKK